MKTRAETFLKEFVASIHLGGLIWSLPRPRPL